MHDKTTMQGTLRTQVFYNGANESVHAGKSRKCILLTKWQDRRIIESLDPLLISSHVAKRAKGKVVSSILLSNNQKWNLVVYLYFGFYVRCLYSEDLRAYICLNFVFSLFGFVIRCSQY